jgi:bacterioferritin-associated ferredoxin
MPMQPDDTVCFCFNVSLRKIETFCTVERPRYASQISECLSAGTGCGWCVPMLTRIHYRICGNAQPWWHQAGETQETAEDAARANESVDAQTYREGRGKYIKEGRGTPPWRSAGTGKFGAWS